MPPQAYALVTTFMACSIVLGFVAVRLAARAGGPRRRLAYLLPIAGAFMAFYMIGHKLGISVGPEITLYGFQVALLGDVSIGFVSALIVAGLQALVTRRRAGAAARA
ncbi:MAG: hypothetical protein WCK58_14525 [Chloroflexota bacterium]